MQLTLAFLSLVIFKVENLPKSTLRDAHLKQGHILRHRQEQGWPDFKSAIQEIAQT